MSNGVDSKSQEDKDDEEFELKSRQDTLMSKQHWVIGQLSHLHKNVHLFQSEKLVKRILTYLTVQAYFEVDFESARSKKGFINHVEAVSHADNQYVVKAVNTVNF